MRLALEGVDRVGERTQEQEPRAEGIQPMVCLENGSLASGLRKLERSIRTLAKAEFDLSSVGIGGY